MKKNIKLNKNIIKALSIGISASMMLQPMTAFASTDSNTLDINPGEENGSETTVASPEALLEAEVGTVKTTDVAPSIDKVEEAISQAEDLTIPTDKIVDRTNKLNTELGLDEQKVSDAEDAMDQINADLINVESTDGAVDAKIDEINGKAKNAQDAKDAADKIQSDFETEVNTAAGLVDEAATAVSDARDGISAATTIEAANAAMNGVEAKVNAADAAVTAAENDLETVEKKYADEKEKYEQAVEAYNTALSELETAKSNFETAKGVAEADAVAAETELQNLATKAENLAKAADEAKNKYDKIGYAYIAKLEADLAAQDASNDGAGKVSVNNARKLCKAIVELYYVPDVLNGTEANLDIQNWHAYNIKNFTYTDEQGNTSEGTTGGDVLNYGVLTYKDAEGNDQVMYINYKTANGNGFDNYGGLVIFEKTAHVVYDGKDIPTATLKKLDAGEAVEFNGELLVKSGDKYVGFSTDAEDTEVKVDKATADVVAYNNVDEETGLGTKVEVTKDETTWNYDAENGTLTKTEKKDYTTTTYTGAGLDAQAATLESETAAENQYKAELQKIIDGLDDDSSFTIGEKTFKKGDTADLSGYVKEESTTVIGYKVEGTYQEKESRYLGRKGLGDGYESANAATNAFENHSFNENTKEWKVGADPLFGYFGGEWAGEKEISEIKSNVETQSHEHWWGTTYYTYSVSGDVTVEYQKVVSVKVSDYYAILGSILNDKSDEERKNLIEADIVRKGGTIVDFKKFDGNFGEASILYIPGHSTGEDGVVINKTDEIDSVAKATAEFNKDKHNSNVSVTEVKTTKYGYSAISVIVETIKKTEGAVVAEQVWKELTGGESDIQLRNDNWYTGNVLIAENWNANGVDYTTDGVQPGFGTEVSLGEKQEAISNDFRTKVDNAAAIAKQYADLSQKARESKEAVLAAKQKVKAIEDKIAALSASTDYNSYEQFAADLTAAKNALAAAVTARDALLEDLAAAKSELQVKVAALTPSTTPVGGNETVEEPTDNTPANTPASTTPVNNGEEETDDTTGDDTTGDDTTGNEETEENGNEAETANITEEGPALAAGPVENKKIEDEDTALAAMPETQQMSWWWLLLILVLGTTGAEMYRRHMVKKNAAKESTDNQ